jgi:hypothetical protein
MQGVNMPLIFAQHTLSQAQDIVDGIVDASNNGASNLMGSAASVTALVSPGVLYSTVTFDDFEASYNRLERVCV